MDTKLDLDYVAGLFDAEGSVGVYPGKRKTEIRFCVSIANAEAVVLHSVESVFGGRVVPVKSISKKASYKSQRPAWAWRAEYKDALRFASTIRRRIQLKRPEMDVFISARTLVGKNGKRVGDENLRLRREAIRMCAYLKKHPAPVFGNFSKPYLAGFFDGEGTLCVNVTKKGYAHVTAGVYNTNCFALEAMKIRYGGSIKTDEHPSPEGRPCFQIEFCGDGASRFLSDIEPHAVIKSEQIRLALEFHDKKSEMKSSGVRIQGRIAEFAVPYRDRISTLNNKGAMTS